MSLFTSLLLYALFGLGIGCASWLRDSGRWDERMFRFLIGGVFWPLFLPLLLRDRPSDPAGKPPEPPGPLASDETSRLIQQVEAELDTALNSLDGWAEDVLARERDCLSELRVAWHSQATRLRDLEQLLAQPSFSLAPESETASPDDRLGQSERGRRENIGRLIQLRDRLRHDLLSTLAWVRELVTLIHLAKYTGAPASRAEELVTQIAASVEGLSEVTNWRTT